jgi:hypothetical protein
MKQPKLTQVLLATSLTLAFASMLVTPAHAELVSEDVQADAITPEANGLQDEMVILKKAPAKAVVVRQQTLPSEPASAIQPVAVQAAPAVSAQAQATATATATAAAPAARPSVGSSLDQGMNSKMDDVRNQFENALLRTLDRIKITVDDGAPAATATATAQATAVAAAPAAPAAPAAAPTTTIVNDSVIQATAAPANYMTVDSQLVDEDEEGSTSVAKADDESEESFVNRIRITPVVGVTNIGSSNSYYEIKSNVTLGLNLEAEVAENFAAYLGYSFAKYDIGLAGYNSYNGGYGYNPLQYNQNLFEAGGRFYLMPSSSKFRVFLGAGLGLTKGYINYGSQSSFTGFGYGVTDYEVNQWLGLLETGAELKVARNVAVGATFKYAAILSASENDRLRNGAFFGGNAGLTQEQVYAGNSIMNQSFYSILGNVKVSF